MKKEIQLNKLKMLLTLPSFTAEDAKAQGISAALLGYYVKRGELVRLARGIYRGKGYNEQASNFQWEDLIEAVHSVPGGVVCLISALALYEITEEIPRFHWIGVSHSTSIKARADVKIVRFRNMEIGKTMIELEGVAIPIFDQERTIIDAFRLLGRETAIKALKSALQKKGPHRIDLIKLQKYAKELRFSIHPYLIAVTT